MGLFGGKKKFAGMTLAELQSTAPPGWCVWVEDGKLHADTSGIMPYAMRSGSFFGPNLESWFSALLISTFSRANHVSEHHSVLLRHYIALLSGLRAILLVAWDVWQDDRPGKLQTLSHNPAARDVMNMFCIPHLFGTLAFLRKSVEKHNRLAAAAGSEITPWDATFMECKMWQNAVGPGVVKTTFQTFLEIGATPSVLQLEIDRLAGSVSETYIPAPAVIIAPAAPSPPPPPSGPSLSEDEFAKLRTLYAGMPGERLRQLLSEVDDLRPGAELLLRQELERRGREEGE
jgi:hypothetical protein